MKYKIILLRAPVLGVCMLFAAGCATNVRAGPPVAIAPATASLAIAAFTVPTYCKTHTSTPGPFEETRRITSCTADIWFSENGSQLYLEDRSGIQFVELVDAQNASWIRLISAQEIENAKSAYNDIVYSTHIYGQSPDERDHFTVTGPHDKYVEREVGSYSYPPDKSEQNWFGPIAISQYEQYSAWLKPMLNDFDNVDLSDPYISFHVSNLEEGRTPYTPKNHIIGVFEGDALVSTAQVEVFDRYGRVEASFSRDNQVVYIDGEERLRGSIRTRSVYRWDFLSGDPELKDCAELGGSRPLASYCTSSAAEIGCAQCSRNGWDIEKIRSSQLNRWIILESNEQGRRARIYDQSSAADIAVFPLEPKTHKSSP